MEEQSGLQGVNRDLLADIMARVDGLDLASFACTSSDLRDVIAGEQGLWKQLCHSTWPSTAIKEAEDLIASSAGGFGKFYAESFPLILYDDDQFGGLPECRQVQSYSSPSCFVSLVDVYWKGKCIFSKILDGIPEAVDISEEQLMDGNWNAGADESQRWFLNSPFKLELLEVKYNDDEEHDLVASGTAFSSTVEEAKAGEDHCKELTENLRLSWVLLDRKAGKAVNLSTRRPLLVQRCWPYNGDYVIQFGCVIPVEESRLQHKLAKCVIATRFKVTEGERGPKWREISLHVESLTGAHVDGRRSLMILNQGLHSKRSTKHIKVENGIREYEKRKTEMKRRKEIKGTLADRLCIATEIVFFAFFCYNLMF